MAAGAEGIQQRTGWTQRGRGAVEDKVTWHSSRTSLSPQDQLPLSLKSSLGEASQTPASGPRHFIRRAELLLLQMTLVTSRACHWTAKVHAAHASGTQQSWLQGEGGKPGNSGWSLNSKFLSFSHVSPLSTWKVLIDKLQFQAKAGPTAMTF